MSLATWMWIATGAYALHALEEFVFDWVTWAKAVMRMPVTLPDFYFTNAVVIVLGVVAANITEQARWVALSFPALMLIDAIIPHIGQMIRTRGRFSPGTFTAVVLFIPIGVASYINANNHSTLGVWEIIGSIAVGAFYLVFAIVPLKIRAKPYFVQAEPD